ncbi:MAG: cupin domain-containing protein [Dongiaceae bacterium]
MRREVILGPDQGRHYDMGPIRAVFKADGAETASRYSVSEWWLEPHHEGPGAHRHEESDELFYVLEGSPSFLVGEVWKVMPRGSFLMIPHGIVHDFRNESDARAGILNIYTPGSFEPDMPAIMDWFRANPAKRI